MSGDGAATKGETPVNFIPCLAPRLRAVLGLMPYCERCGADTHGALYLSGGDVVSCCAECATIGDTEPAREETRGMIQPTVSCYNIAQGNPEIAALIMETCRDVHDGSYEPGTFALGNALVTIDGNGAIKRWERS